MQLVNPTDAQRVPQAPIPTAWAARLIERFKALYGHKFAQQWSSTDPKRLVEIWAEEIADYTAEELQRGLSACRGRPWPPTLPEFLSLARPGLNPEAAYHEAVAGMSARSRNEMGNWTHPGIYWAAVRVTSHDLLNQGWQAIKPRWEAALRDIMAQGRWEPVPAPALALTAPGKSTPSREEAHSFLRELKNRVGVDLTARPRDHRAWPHKVMARVARGENVSPFVVAAAQAAIDKAREVA